ncbi:MAG: hypothetical protein ACSHX9_08630 [Luteolibacter sp.]
MLHLNPTPLTLWIGIAALIGVAFLCFLSWKRSPHPGRTAALEILRFFIAVLVVMLLWQPEWKTVINPTTKPKIVVLWDDSRSMETLDAELPEVLLGEGDAEEIVSRKDWVDRALGSDLWTPLKSDGANELVSLPFAKPSEEGLSGTDMNQPLSDLLEKDNNLRAVVVIGDGDFNLGDPPVAAAQKYRLRGVPIFTIPVGSQTRLPDLDMLTVTAPTYGIVGENVQIPFTIRSSLDRQVRTVVRLRDESGRERTKSIILSPNAETYDSILWRLKSEGSSTLTLSVPVEDGELVSANNSRDFTIAGKPEQIRVLILETLPRWEFRFLRNALQRDPGVELSCLLMRPELGPAEGLDYIEKFPESLEELSKFDVVFIGDIGVGPDQLTAEQCEQIRGLVENQASGVVFLPGMRGNQFTLLDTALSDLMPVTLDDNNKEGFPESLATPLNLTTEGRASLLTMLGDSEEENPEIWRQLPGFLWHAPVVRAKGGTQVLAVHANRRGPYGPIPLLVTKAAGSGKVLFMGIDSAWRWRRGVEDLYHYRFWGQVARWMSYQRNMAAGQRVRLFYTPERPEPGATVTLNANAFDENGAPQKEGSVFVDVTSPGGDTRRIELQKNESEWGAYTGRFKIELPGAWKLRATVSGASDLPTETTILAQGVDIEKTGQPARPEVLEEMAKVSRGRLILPDQLPGLIDEIEALPEPRPIENRIPLWSHWATVAVLVLLLGGFWVGRKLNGAF